MCDGANGRSTEISAPSGNGRSWPRAAYRAIVLVPPEADVQACKEAGGTSVSATNAKPRNDVAGLHRLATCCGLTSSRHRDVCRPVVAGFRVALSEVSSIGLISIHDFTLRLAPAGVQVASLASRPLSSTSVPRFGIILNHRFEGGRCRFASGTPAIRGAHNSGTLAQQPDHQLI